MIYLFDIDGTILLTHGSGTRALNAVFLSRHGIENGMAGVSCGGKTDPVIITEMYRLRLDRDPTRAEIDDILEQYVPRLRADLSANPLPTMMPSIHDALDFLESDPRVTLGLATGNIREGARAKLERVDLWDRFGFGGFGCDHENRGELVKRAVERGRARVQRQVSDEEIVVVGDTVHDVTAARAAGVRVVAVATGSVSRHTLAAAGPDVVLDTLAELPAWHEANAG